MVFTNPSGSSIYLDTSNGADPAVKPSVPLRWRWIFCNNTMKKKIDDAETGLKKLNWGWEKIFTSPFFSLFFPHLFSSFLTT